MGVFNLSVVIPQLLVSVLAGFLFEASGSAETVFWLAGGSVGLSALLWSLV